MVDGVTSQLYKSHLARHHMVLLKILHMVKPVAQTKAMIVFFIFTGSPQNLNVRCFIELETHLKMSC